MPRNTEWTAREWMLLMCVIAFGIACSWFSWQLWGWFIRLHCGVPL